MKKKLQPYIFISFTGLLAFAPVSFMIRSLKNDIIALEYPINYFISQCIHNGEMPYWFNTWAMGFPLQSNLTWGIFSTPQMLFCSIFNYDIFALHIEFMFFVLMAGCGMYHLLKKYFLKDESISIILACCYMLSGFIIGSGQWMLYITAAAFIPVVLSSLLLLLKQPSLRHSALFAVLYFMMFTSVYTAFNIITTYCLIFFTAGYLLINNLPRKEKNIRTKYVLFAGIITILLCLPVFLSSLELLNYLKRGNPILSNTDFFNSNYLHPYGLSTMLLPFSSVKMNFPNTEGTMLYTYTGLFTLLVLPLAIWQTIKEKNKIAFIILISCIFFLLISFGGMLPFRKALNFLPGFSYFRNPAIFRFYFIFLLIIFVGMGLRKISWENIFDLKNGQYSRTLKFCFLILLLLCLSGLLMNINSIRSFSFVSITQLIKDISFSQTTFISAAIQLLFLGAIFYTSFRKQYRFVKYFIAAELIINTLLCTPYFVVSSYSLPQVNTILNSTKGFPVQHEMITNAAATYTDEKLNHWNNVNIFHKLVSVNETYHGPLELKNFSLFINDSTSDKTIFKRKLVFSGNDSLEDKERLKIILQRPTHIRVQVNADEPTNITAMQNYFPGWKAYYNNKYVEFIKTDKPGLSVAVPKGIGIVDFIYSKRNIWITALLLHLFTIFFLLNFVVWKVKKIRSSFLSLPSR
ncbi:MAG: hypothetical protein JJE22_14955 [Bacteroidia bacterium]|nr:hypothetical protein [Bacteroidia bacterium]